MSNNPSAVLSKFTCERESELLLQTGYFPEALCKYVHANIDQIADEIINTVQNSPSHISRPASAAYNLATETLNDGFTSSSSLFATALISKLALSSQLNS